MTQAGVSERRLVGVSERWTASAGDRCPICGSKIFYAHLDREEKWFKCGAVTQRDEVVKSCAPPRGRAVLVPAFT